MASFIQEKNKTWTCEYLKTKPNGTESRTNKRGFKTKKEALQWHTNYEQQVSMGVNLDASAMTIATWMDQWLQTYCVGRAANTIASHRNNTRHIKEWIGGYTLKSIRPEHIQSFYNSFVQSTHKKGKTYSAAMLERVHCTLNAAMRRAVANRYIVFNPCDLLDRPQKEPPEKLYCPSDQLSTLLQLSKETDFYIPILLCCMLGLRRGEALGLKWDDIEGDIVHIRMQVTQDNYAGGYVYKSLKTKRAMRDLTLPDILRKELKNQYKKHLANKLRYAEVYQDDGFVCADEGGKVLSPSMFTYTAKSLMAKAGIDPRIRLHDLRHSYATLLRKAGVSIETISDLLGHSNVRVTHDFYVASDREAVAEAATIISNIIGV